MHYYTFIYMSSYFKNKIKRFLKLHTNHHYFERINFRFIDSQVHGYTLPKKTNAWTISFLIDNFLLGFFSTAGENLLNEQIAEKFYFKLGKKIKLNCGKIQKKINYLQHAFPGSDMNTHKLNVVGSVEKT